MVDTQPEFNEKGLQAIHELTSFDYTQGGTNTIKENSARTTESIVETLHLMADESSQEVQSLNAEHYGFSEVAKRALMGLAGGAAMYYIFGESWFAGAAGLWLMKTGFEREFTDKLNTARTKWLLEQRPQLMADFSNQIIELLSPKAKERLSKGQSITHPLSVVPILGPQRVFPKPSNVKVQDISNEH